MESKQHQEKHQLEESLSTQQTFPQPMITDEENEDLQQFQRDQTPLLRGNECQQEHPQHVLQEIKYDSDAQELMVPEYQADIFPTDRLHHLVSRWGIFDFSKELPTDPIESVFEFDGKFGGGSQGSVFRASHRITGFKVAIKKVTPGDNTKEQRLLREIYFQAQCSHDHIAKLYETYINGRTYYLVMEALTGGDLFDRLRKQRRFTEEDASRIVKSIALALNYLHEIGIAHRDLKPENIVLTEPDCPPWSVKIIDFGFAYNGPLHTPLGSGFYVSPEVCHIITHSQHRIPPHLRLPYTTQTDMWTLGIITYVLLTGKPPFRIKDTWHTDRALHNAIFLAKYDTTALQSVSDQAKDLVGQLLKPNPSERLQAKLVLSHEWISRATDFSCRDLSSPRRLGENGLASVRDQLHVSIHAARVQDETMEGQTRTHRGFAARAARRRHTTLKKQIDHETTNDHPEL